jgi:hypothetical protein
MARGAPKNPINDIKDAVGAWLGGNRGSVPSSGAGAAWQASARSAAQSGNRRIVKGLEEGVVQFGALGMGTSAQAQRDLMYGVPGAGTQAAKEASVSYVTGAALGYGVGKVAGKVVRDVVPAVAVARNAPRGNLAAQRGLLHGTSQKFKPGDVILPASKLPNKPVWNVSNPNVAYATSDQTFALKAANTARFQRVTQNKGLMSGLLNPRVEKGIPVRESVGELGAKGYNKLVRSNRARIYEVEPVNPATVKINKVDKIREKQSAEGFIVKREVFRGPVFDKQFPKAVKKYRGGGTKKR